MESSPNGTTGFGLGDLQVVVKLDWLPLFGQYPRMPGAHGTDVEHHNSGCPQRHPGVKVSTLTSRRILAQEYRAGKRSGPDTALHRMAPGPPQGERVDGAIRWNGAAGTVLLGRCEYEVVRHFTTRTVRLVLWVEYQLGLHRRSDVIAQVLVVQELQHEELAQLTFGLLSLDLGR